MLILLPCYCESRSSSPSTVSTGRPPENYFKNISLPIYRASNMSKFNVNVEGSQRKFKLSIVCTT